MNRWQDVAVRPDESFERRLESDLVAELFGPQIGRAEPTARWTTEHHTHTRNHQEDMMVIELEEQVQETKPRPRWLAVAAAAVLTIGAGAVILSQRDDNGTAAATHDVTFDVQWPELQSSMSWRCNGTTNYASTQAGTQRCLRGWGGEAQLTGDVDGVAMWDMVANAGDEGRQGEPEVDTPATFNATYLVKGEVAGCGTGEFMIAEVTRFLGWDLGQFVGTWQVMPGSERGELVGLSGSGEVPGEFDTTDGGTPHTFTGTMTCG